MLLRIRWFLIGALSMVGAGTYLLGKLRQMRARLTAANLRRASGMAVADVLGATARAVAPDRAEEAPY